MLKVLASNVDWIKDGNPMENRQRLEYYVARSD